MASLSLPRQAPCKMLAGLVTYKNLIHLLNLQFYCVNGQYARITTTWVVGSLLGD